MRPALLFFVCALTACAPPVEPADASADGADARQPSDADAADAPPAVESGGPDVESGDASLDSGVPMDAPDDRPDPRDAGSDARDAAPDVVCPADGFGGYEWRSCYGVLCCPRGRCGLDINDRPYCQG